MYTHVCVCVFFALILLYSISVRKDTSMDTLDPLECLLMIRFVNLKTNTNR